jgi:hypothetical protein
MAGRTPNDEIGWKAAIPFRTLASIFKEAGSTIVFPVCLAIDLAGLCAIA